MNVKMRVENTGFEFRGCATMPIYPVSQKLIQWQAGVLKEVTGLAEWLKWSSRTALIM